MTKIMKEKILLDTSVIRASSTKNLVMLLNEGLKLFASSYSFWEILCHLDENSKFGYFKSHLSKFKYLSILDDPFGIRAKYTKIHQPALKNRINDEELILGIVFVLESSDSIQHFYSSVYTDSQKKSHKIQDCALRGREILAGASDRYVGFVTKIIETIKNNNMKYQSCLDRDELILQLIGGWVRGLEDQGANNNDLGQNFTNEVYVYFSYILHQALKYLKKNNEIIDPNDYEDSQICLHLSPDSSFIFIADDQNLYESVDQTICLLHELGDENSKVTLQVRKSDYLMKLLA